MAGAAGAAAFLVPVAGCRESGGTPSKFRYCLNTSTISGQAPGLKGYIDIAAETGYDGVELWVRDVRAWLEEGNSAPELKRYIEDRGLTVENAIGFAPWLSPGGEGREKGFRMMREDMEVMASVGCLRIAAPPAGLTGEVPLDLFGAGRRYRDLVALGRETGVMPQLEFWGASPVLFHLAQALMIIAVAGDPDAMILPDVYHLFRGGANFETLNILRGDVIRMIHMNDYVAGIPRTQQKDADRVYPGDGVAPMQDIMASLSAMGGTKVLSVELFNRTYWEQDPAEVAATALRKMKDLPVG